jgi:hypothetical protein
MIQSRIVVPPLGTKGIQRFEDSHHAKGISTIAPFGMVRHLDTSASSAQRKLDASQAHHKCSGHRDDQFARQPRRQQCGSCREEKSGYEVGVAP